MQYVSRHRTHKDEEKVMFSDYKPIIKRLDPSLESVELYFAHDLHKGDSLHDSQKWEKFKAEILAEPNRFVIFCGDFCDYAVANSKGNVYEQTIPPQIQKEWFTEQLIDLKSRTLAIVPGNHETNRITRVVGLFPAYDCASAAGLDSIYRQHFAFLDLGVGMRLSSRNKQVHYVGYITHRLKDCKAYNGSDFVDGIDFAAYGHDHDPKDHARAKLVYDSKNKYVATKNIEIIDSGAFLNYGGYAVEHGYRPISTKCHKLILSGTKKRIQTVGFYVD